MKLFGDFEAVRFPEEDLIFITKNQYLYYIYNPKNEVWKKHDHAGNNRITVENYQDVTKEEIIEIMGKFPNKETDFIKQFRLHDLQVMDMIELLEEDYKEYLTDYKIYNSVQTFFIESDLTDRSYIELQRLFDNGRMHGLSTETMLVQLKELCFNMCGRDIFKKKIEIIDGRDTSSYFLIGNARMIDDRFVDEMKSVASMNSVEISIEEDDVLDYLFPYLDNYFDAELEANQKRVEYTWTDQDGNQQAEYVHGFEWYLEPNYFTYDEMHCILHDIRDTIEALETGRQNAYTTRLKKHTSTDKKELLIDFYQRFIYRMEYMMKVGEERGYHLIFFTGP